MGAAEVIRLEQRRKEPAGRPLKMCCREAIREQPTGSQLARTGGSSAGRVRLKAMREGPAATQQMAIGTQSGSSGPPFESIWWLTDPAVVFIQPVSIFILLVCRPSRFPCPALLLGQRHPTRSPRSSFFAPSHHGAFGRQHRFVHFTAVLRDFSRGLPKSPTKKRSLINEVAVARRFTEKTQKLRRKGRQAV